MFPSTKDDGRDDHSGHSGQYHATQPMTTGRKFFERMAKRPDENSVPQTRPHEDPIAIKVEPGKSLLQRSPSLPIMRTLERREVLQRTQLQFSSPPRQRREPEVGTYMKRSPSVPSLARPHTRHHQDSPVAHSAMTPLTVEQINKYNQMQSGTPMQRDKVAGPGRPPLQCITPQNPKPSNNMLNSNRKLAQPMDKENSSRIGKNYLEGGQVLISDMQGKEPTPEWKRNFIHQMREPSPVGMDGCASMKRCSSGGSSVSNKAARNLFTADGASPDQPESLGLFREPARPVAEIEARQQQMMYDTPQPAKAFAPQQMYDTPVPAKKFAQQNDAFAFKQPVVPSHRPKEATHPDFIVVNNIPYKKGEKLGKGGSSDVFQIFRMADDAEFALKIVYLKDADECVKQGFLNEINFLQRMQGCDKVIQLIDHEFCEEEKVLLVIMERGVRDMSAFLKDRARKRDLRISTVFAFWKDMVEAVYAVHEQGIIHSDLKPANFILCGDLGCHRVKLIDFGIASSIQTDVTSVVKEHPAGTLNYMSPEALMGVNAKINFKSDVWALGCILYCLLYGCTPFQHIKNYSQKAAMITDPNHTISFPERSQSLPGDGLVPPGLLETVQACLSYKPQDRPSTKDLLAIKYCGCDNHKQQTNSIEILAQGLASLVREHSMGGELATHLMAALYKGSKH